MPDGDQAFYRGGDRLIGGVCSGLAAGLHIDPVWIRVAFVLLAFVQGVGVLIYIVLWLVMPERMTGTGPRSGMDSMADDVRRIAREIQVQLGSMFGSGPAGQAGPAPPSVTSTSPSTAAPPAPAPAPPPPPHFSGSTTRQSVALGVILVFAGIVILAANTGIVAWTVIWPAALIIIGVVLFLRTLERRA